MTRTARERERERGKERDRMSEREMEESERNGDIKKTTMFFEHFGPLN